MSATAKHVEGIAHLEPRQQFAALPYRTAGELKVLLITSRETRRWVIPKGWPMKGKSPQATAAREAMEEAGVVGQIAKKALGAYAYDKRLKTGQSVPCLVEVYPLKVSAQKSRWPEKKERTSQWFDWEEAAQAVEEPGLAELIRALAVQTRTKLKKD